MDLDLDAITAAAANDDGGGLRLGAGATTLARAVERATQSVCHRGDPRRLLPVEEVCRLYSLSSDEILSCERTIYQRGVTVLHIKQLQINRYVRGRS